MDLLSGYSDNALAGFNGYTPQANAAIANNNSEYYRNQAAIALMAQQQIDRNTAAIAATGPSSGYGTVGGYPSFGEAQDLTGRSSFSGTPLGGYPSGSVERGADLPDLSQSPFSNTPQGQADAAAFQALNGGGGWGGAMAMPDAQRLLGYNPNAGVQNPWIDSGQSYYSTPGSGPYPAGIDTGNFTTNPSFDSRFNAAPGAGLPNNTPADFPGMQIPQNPNSFNSYGQPGVGGGGMSDPFAGQNSGYVPEWLRAYRENFGREPDGSPLSGGSLISSPANAAGRGGDLTAGPAVDTRGAGLGTLPLGGWWGQGGFGTAVSGIAPDSYGNPATSYAPVQGGGGLPSGAEAWAARFAPLGDRGSYTPGEIEAIRAGSGDSSFNGRFGSSTGGTMTPQQLVDSANGLNMPSGAFGGRGAEDYRRLLEQYQVPNAGSLGAGGIYTDPFGGYVPGGAVGPSGLPADYAPRYDAQQLQQRAALDPSMQSFSA